MNRIHSSRNFFFIAVFALAILISGVMAVQFHSLPGTSSHVAEVNDLPPEPLNPDQNYNEIIQPTVDKQAPEENPAVVVGTPPGNEVKDVREERSVSRGTATAITASKNTGTNGSNFWQSRKTWLQPVKGRQIADPTGGARYFGASRANGRAHAAIDFIAPSGTLVYAMTDGKVIRTSTFFENTSAVEVRNTDGTIARYCEIAPAVSVNAMVHRGDVIGKIISNYGGTSMLHLEMYAGTASGSLSQSNTSNYRYVTVRDYERRSDLVDPTGAIYLPVK